MKYDNAFHLDIGNTLRKLRNTNDLTQEHVSNYLEISRQAYLEWEKNSINFSISQLQKISILYNIPVHMIIMDSYTPYK